MIRCLIVEDEFAAQQILLKKLARHPEIRVVAVIDNKDDAIAFINRTELDLVFFDVQIKGGTGLDVFQECTNRNFEAVFITAYDQYAIEALNGNASYYLLKPIRDTEFQKGMAVVLSRIQTARNSAIILVPNKGVQLPIRVDDIICLESDGAYTNVITTTEKYVSSKNLGHYEKVLSPTLFVRSHHSFLVNISKIQSFKKGRSGLLIMKNGAEIPVAQRRMNDFIDYFVNPAEE